jgi:hypothetical protein
MASPETRTQPFDVPVSEPRQRRRSMIDDHMVEPFAQDSRRGSNGSDIDPLPTEKRDRRMYEPTICYCHDLSSININKNSQEQRMGRIKGSSLEIPED